MWIARNKDGSFSLSDTRLIRGHIFGTCPTDNNGNPIENYWVCLDGSTPSPLYLNIFPNLTWEHEPIEVDFHIIYNPNWKYYELIKRDDFWFVIILSIEQTGVYWKDLLNEIKECNVPVYFDFIYRNGCSNRFFVLKDRNLKATKENKEFSRITLSYFKNNPEILNGSILTKNQINNYLEKS